MQRTLWDTVIRRISPATAEDIDDLTSDYDKRVNPVGNAVFATDSSWTAVGSTGLSDEIATIGYRISKPRSDLAVVAMKLASLGMEHEAEVVVMSEIDYSGLEAFGFRVERLAGQSNEQLEACEKQVSDFWALDMIL